MKFVEEIVWKWKLYYDLILPSEYLLNSIANIHHKEILYVWLTTHCRFNIAIVRKLKSSSVLFYKITVKNFEEYASSKSNHYTYIHILKYYHCYPLYGTRMYVTGLCRCYCPKRQNNIFKTSNTSVNFFKLRKTYKQSRNFESDKLNRIRIFYCR